MGWLTNQFSSAPTPEQVEDVRSDAAHFVLDTTIETTRTSFGKATLVLLAECSTFSIAAIIALDCYLIRGQIFPALVAATIATSRLPNIMRGLDGSDSYGSDLEAPQQIAQEQRAHGSSSAPLAPPE